MKAWLTFLLIRLCFKNKCAYFFGRLSLILGNKDCCPLITSALYLPPFPWALAQNFGLQCFVFFPFCWAPSQLLCDFSKQLRMETVLAYCLILQIPIMKVALSYVTILLFNSLCKLTIKSYCREKKIKNKTNTNSYNKLSSRVWFTFLPGVKWGS